MTYLPDGEGLLVLVGSLEGLPSIFRRSIAYNTVQGEEAIDVAISSDVNLGLADTAGLGSLVGAISLAVARLATATALASEFALNPLVRAVGSVVTGFVTVVAETRVEALLLLLGTVASEVTVGAAARKSRRVSRMSRVNAGQAEHTCGSRCHRRRAWRRSGRYSQCRRRNRHRRR